MKKFLGLGAIIIALLFMSACQKPIYNVQNTISVKNKKLEDIYNAIKLGAENANWSTKRISKNELIATTRVRVHVAKVKIKFNESSYSIKFFKGINIKQRPKEGTIHENYNKWVALLEAEIEDQLIILKSKK